MLAAKSATHFDTVRNDSAPVLGGESEGSAGRTLDFRSIYDEWVGHVARWIRALGCPPADYEDLVQEVFLVVHRRLPDFDGAHVAAWLYRITAHRVRDFRRSRWVASIFGRSSPLTSSTGATYTTPLCLLETQEKRAVLESLLKTLTEPQRVAFVLFEIDGYTAAEIAQIQESYVSTVRARVFRARQALTRELKKRHLRLEES